MTIHAILVQEPANISNNHVGYIITHDPRDDSYYWDFNSYSPNLQNFIHVQRSVGRFNTYYDAIVSAIRDSTNRHITYHPHEYARLLAHLTVELTRQDTQ